MNTHSDVRRCRRSSGRQKVLLGLMVFVLVLGVGIIGVAANLAHNVEAFRQTRTATYWAGVIVSWWWTLQTCVCRCPLLTLCNGACVPYLTLSRNLLSIGGVIHSWSWMFRCDSNVWRFCRGAASSRFRQFVMKISMQRAILQTRKAACVRDVIVLSPKS